MTAKAPMDVTPARPEHPYTDEEEKHLKNNFKEIKETLKEEIEKSFNEIEADPNQNLQETIQETVQGLRALIEKIKKHILREFCNEKRWVRNYRCKQNQQNSIETRDSQSIH